MPLVTCPECRHDVSPLAGACPECGAPVREMKDAWAKRLAGWIVGVTIIAGVVWMFFCCGGVGETGPRTPDKLTAWVKAQRYVTEQLRSPSTADFGGWSEFQNHEVAVTDLGAGKFRVRGWVDAQNALGGTVRNQFVCDVECLGATRDARWQCTRLELGGEVLIE